MELALSLEKLNFSKLRALHEVAEKHGDSQMCDFVGTCEAGWLAGAGVAGGGARTPGPCQACLASLQSSTLPPARASSPAEGSLLADQAASVRAVAEMVAQLRRVGGGLGVYTFDQNLQKA